MYGDDLLTPDNNNEPSYSVPEAANDAYNLASANKRGEKLDNFIDNLKNGKDKKPEGKDIKPETMDASAKDASSSIPGGSDIGAKGSDIADAASKGTEAMAKGAEIGEKGMEIGSQAAQVGGTVVAEGGTVAAEGTAAVVAGAPTMGIGAAVVLGLSVLNMGTKAVKKALKKANKNIDEIIHNKKTSDTGFAGTLLVIGFILIFFLCVVITPIFMPQAVFTAVVNNLKDAVVNGVNGKFESYTEKGKFFEDLFNADELGISDGELYKICNSQAQVDTNNVVIYKAIIDKGIENAYKDYIREYATNPENCFKFALSWVQENFGGIQFTKFSSKAAEIYLNEQPYFYALPKSNGEAYTVGEYLDNPEQMVNNDINYAEIITVYSQKTADEDGYLNMSYSDFYDSIAGKKHAGMFFEMDIETEPTYFYWNNKDHSSFTEVATKEEARKHRSKEENKAEKDANTSEEASDSSSTTSDDEDEEFEELSDEKGGSYGWGYFYKVTLYPYGLDEIYEAAGVNKFAESSINSNFYNIDCLDIQEGFLRTYIGSKKYLGPSYSEKRNERSLWNALYNKESLEPNGRTPGRWISESALKELVVSYLGEGGGGIVVDYKPNGESVILDFNMDSETSPNNRYICQGDFGNTPRGDGTRTIAGAACIDCSYTMAAQYYNESLYDIPKICKDTSEGGYVIGQSFYYGKFCEDMGMTRMGCAKSTSEIVSHITQGHPVVIGIKGFWYASNGRTLHNTDSTHYFLVIGYDNNGFYLADPGSRNNTKNGPITYSDFSKAPIFFIEALAPAKGQSPKYKYNSIRGY